VLLVADSRRMASGAGPLRRYRIARLRFDAGRSTEGALAKAAEPTGQPIA
jgi:hypothetical protein